MRTKKGAGPNWQRALKDDISSSSKRQRGEQGGVGDSTDADGGILPSRVCTVEYCDKGLRNPLTALGVLISTTPNV